MCLSVCLCTYVCVCVQMQALVQEMLHSEQGVPIRSLRHKLNLVPSVFTGEWCSHWKTSRLILSELVQLTTTLEPTALIPAPHMTSAMYCVSVTVY